MRRDGGALDHANGTELSSLQAHERDRCSRSTGNGAVQQADVGDVEDIAKGDECSCVDATE